MPEGVATTRSYRFKTVLGKGGFGKVYLAELLGEVSLFCAIKLPEGGEEELRRLYDEARMLALLQHPSIVRINDLVKFGSSPAIVLEFVDGVDLLQVLRANRPVPHRVALEIVQCVAAALDHAAHHPGPSGQPLRLKHRDIKPRNIMITRLGEVKLLDFGIASAEMSDRMAETVKGYTPYSKGYRSPERIHTGTCDAPGDIYALGAVLFELLAANNLGEPGEPIERASYENWLESRLNYLAMRSGRADEIMQITGLIERMLAFTPESRVEASDVVDAIDQFQRGMTGQSLRAWARTQLVHIQKSTDIGEQDDRCGRVLEATIGQAKTDWTTRNTAPPPPPGSPPDNSTTENKPPLTVKGVMKWLAGGGSTATVAVLLINKLLSTDLSTSDVEDAVEVGGKVGRYFDEKFIPDEPEQPAEPNPNSPPVPVPIEDQVAPVAPIVPPVAPPSADPVIETDVQPITQPIPKKQAPAPRPTTATVKLMNSKDGVVVTLIGTDNQPHALPASTLAPGSYKVKLKDERGIDIAGTLSLEAGDSVRLQCDYDARKCPR